MKRVAAAVVERWFTPEFRASCPDAVAKAQRMLENTPPEGYAACCAAVRDMDQNEEIARIKAPTLVVYGGRDPVIPVPEAQFLVIGFREADKVEPCRCSPPFKCRASRCIHTGGEQLCGRVR